MVDSIALQCVLRVLEYLNWPKTLYGSVEKHIRTLLSVINYAANVVKQVVW